MESVKGKFTKIDGREFYEIENYDKLDPFLFTLAASNDIWIYLSSNGGVTAGRMSAERAFFPYLTEDRLYHSTDTGAKTIVKVTKDGKTSLWQPFTNAYIEGYQTTRNLDKSVIGNEVIFEEINHCLGITFRYGWQSCEKYGIVRTASIVSDSDVDVEIIDGMLNILPFGVRSAFQLELPCLADAYKSSEIIGDHTAVYSLTSAINDKPTPEEMLRCNIAWAIADFPYQLYVSEKALKQFVNGTPEKSDTSFGDRGAFLMSFKL